MTRTGSLQKKYFDFIKSGEKTIEGRPAGWLTKDNNNTTIGDIIIWKNGSDSIKTEVVSITHANSFVDLYDIFGEKLLPGIKSSAEAAKVYEEWYGDVKVVGIELKVIE